LANFKKKYPVKIFPIVGACGLDCGLCPRFHSGGDKPCPGCCGEGFWERNPGCAFITCCVKQRGQETCGECNELEFCPRVLRNLEASKRRDSMLSYKTLPANLDAVQYGGLEAFIKRQQEKIDFLRLLLTEYNDGRSKGFYCLSVQLLPLEDIKLALAGCQSKITPDTALKDKTRLVREAFNALAAKLNIELKLRTGNPAK
jgi:hypothetical protein